MRHFHLGYLIVEPIPFPSWKAQQLGPNPLYTASDCLCPIHPGKWGLSWASSKEDVDEMQMRLGISEETLRQIQAEVQILFDQELYGFPNIFYRKTDALHFQSSYLGKVTSKVIRLALPETFLEEALSELKPEDGDGETGVFHNLKLREDEPDSGEFLGYEILCWDTAGFHSFICNGLEKEYEEHLNLKFNSRGYFIDFDSAMKATEYTRRDDVRAEPGYWAPIKIVRERG